jgi:ATP-dependent DNA helicase RecG
LELSFDQLWKRLLAGDESVMIEAKAGSEVGTSVQETISSFANEPGRGGGYLILGIGRVEMALFPTYEVIGVPDSDKLQSELATQCRTVFNCTVRPDISVEVVRGRTVVVVFIQEVQPSEKPVFIQRIGLPRGAFRRIGSTDQHCTDDDIQLFYQQRSHQSFDETVLADADLKDIDSAVVAEYRRTRQDANPEAPELAYSDTDLLLCLKCLKHNGDRLCPTIAGIILFGKPIAIRRHFPMMRIDYIRINGKEWVPDPDKRFESIEILSPLLTAIPRAISAVLDDIPQAFRLSATADQRTDVPLIPRSAIREAIVNCVMHRSYRHKSPVQIIRYSNRIEFRNPGHSLVPDDRLGEPGSITRNEMIAAVLHETRFAETKGSGIRSMREAMSIANLSPPFFESDRERDTFVATFLFHHFLSSSDAEWLGAFSSLELSTDEQRALVFAREVGAINNLAYRNMNKVDTLTASGHLRRLRDMGLFDQKGKSTQTYYVPTKFMLNSEGHQLPTRATANVSAFEPIPAQDELLRELPEAVKSAVAALGVQSPSAQQTKAVIKQICSVRAFSAREIASILGRKMHYIRARLLRDMVRSGELVYTNPANPSHPSTKYATPPADTT